MKEMKDYKHHYAIRGKLYFSHKAAAQSNRTAGCERFAYNRMVSVNEEIYRLKKVVDALPYLQERIDYLEQSIESASSMKNSAPFLYEVDDGAIQNARRNYNTAWMNYREGRSGIPTLHRKSSERSWHTNPHYNKGETDMTKSRGFRLDDRSHVVLPKIGRVRVKFSPKIIDRIFEMKSQVRVGTATITEDACGDHFISIILGSDEPFVSSMEKTGKAGAFDLNLSNFLTTDDGDVVDNPHTMARLSDKLVREQRILSRRRERAKAEGRPLSSAKNYQKQRIRVAGIHRQISRQRLEHQQITAKELIKTHDLIFAEDLRAKNLMANHRLAKAIADVSWRQFLTIMKQKSSMYGKQFLLVDPKNTTQTCSSCGHVMSGDDKIPLGVDEWTCPSCGAFHVRDHNAAKNILAAGLQKTGT